MHWILQNNLFNDSAYQALLATVIRLGLSHSTHKVVPFVGELVPDIKVETKNVICMGAYSLRHAAEQRDWTPGVFDIGHCDFRMQVEKWGKHMLNHDSVICRFEEACIVVPSFIRPIHDSKVFAGRMIDPEELEDWRQKVCVLDTSHADSLNKDTLIQITGFKQIYSEHRFWVVKGRIVTSSTYKLGHSVVHQKLPADSVFQEFAEERIAEWQPHDAFVIDIADTDAGLKVVEINTLNSCGFYACDIEQLVMALDDEFDRDRR